MFSVADNLSLSVPRVMSPLQFYLPPRPRAERSVVSWRLGAVCCTHAGLGLVPGIRLLHRFG